MITDTFNLQTGLSYAEINVSFLNTSDLWSFSVGLGSSGEKVFQISGQSGRLLDSQGKFIDSYNESLGFRVNFYTGTNTLFIADTISAVKTGQPLDINTYTFYGNSIVSPEVKVYGDDSPLLDKSVIFVTDDAYRDSEVIDLFENFWNIEIPVTSALTGDGITGVSGLLKDIYIFSTGLEYNDIQYSGYWMNQSGLKISMSRYALEGVGAASIIGTGLSTTTFETESGVSRKLGELSYSISNTTGEAYKFSYTGEILASYSNGEAFLSKYESGQRVGYNFVSPIVHVNSSISPTGWSEYAKQALLNAIIENI